MPSERPDSPLVIGVGNRDRGDDGIGPAVVDELRRRVLGLAALTVGVACAAALGMGLAAAPWLLP